MKLRDPVSTNKVFQNEVLNSSRRSTKENNDKKYKENMKTEIKVKKLASFLENSKRVFKEMKII